MQNNINFGQEPKPTGRTIQGQLVFDNEVFPTSGARRVAKWGKRHSEKKSQKQVNRQRRSVENQYRKTHSLEVTVIPKNEQSPEELRLTRNGKYEYSSNGVLTSNGKSQRLADRYNLLIVTLSILIVIVFLVLFFVNF